MRPGEFVIRPYSVSELAFFIFHFSFQFFGGIAKKQYLCSWHGGRTLC